MARGTAEKEQLFDIFKTLFPSMFNDGTNWRIPVSSPEGELQFKLALTCAKENVEHDGEVHATAETVNAVGEKTELTDEEKQKITDFLTRLGLYKA